MICPPQPAGPLGQIIPANDHPLRAGADQTGGNRYRGQIGRVTLFRGKLSLQAIGELAVGDRTQAINGPQVAGCWLNLQPDDALSTNAEDFAGGVSLEAWIQPEDKESRRVLDKLTVGRNDGFLPDTWPSLSLRLIAGNRQKHFPDVLKPGVWQHVAVVLDRSVPRVYLNGHPVQ